MNETGTILMLAILAVWFMSHQRFKDFMTVVRYQKS